MKASLLPYLIIGETKVQKNLSLVIGRKLINNKARILKLNLSDFKAHIHFPTFFRYFKPVIPKTIFFDKYCVQYLQILFEKSQNRHLKRIRFKKYV